jgi:hypothetical protein
VLHADAVVALSETSLQVSPAAQPRAGLGDSGLRAFKVAVVTASRFDPSSDFVGVLRLRGTASTGLRRSGASNGDGPNI